MENNPELSIVILSYNTDKILEDSLASVYRFSQGINFEVLVVDNASSDGSVAMVKNKFAEAKLIENKSNLGFAKGNNSAREIARGKYIRFYTKA
jgi:GT2 family glycosyltransferase